jgi:hypothetical protein
MVASKVGPRLTYGVSKIDKFNVLGRDVLVQVIADGQRHLLVQEPGCWDSMGVHLARVFPIRPNVPHIAAARFPIRPNFPAASSFQLHSCGAAAFGKAPLHNVSTADGCGRLSFPGARRVPRPAAHVSVARSSPTVRCEFHQHLDDVNRIVLSKELHPTPRYPLSLFPNNPDKAGICLATKQTRCLFLPLSSFAERSKGT